jgi:dihydrofolate reductase
MTVKMIVAVDRGNAIGWQDGRLPWKLSHDMKRFKALTTGGTVVMGRTTYQSLGRPDGLPNRKNYVLTRRPYSEVRGQFGEVDIISSLDTVVRNRCSMGVGCDEYGVCYATARNEPDRCPKSDDLWIIGGASVYAEALEKNMVDELYLTLVHTTSGADVTLKDDLSAWKLWVLREQKAGRFWVLTEHEDTPPNGETPATTYITLKKANP